MNAQELIDTQPGGPNGMQFMAWKARAKECLGGDAPDTKDKILEALTAKAEAERPPEPEMVVPPSGAVEVDLHKKYAPFKIMNDEGEWIDQGEVKQQVPAGLAYLHPDEAASVLERKQASPTQNTFRQMRG